jgi:phosphomannomutase
MGTEDQGIMTDADIVMAAEKWLAQDPDAETRAELTELLAHAASATRATDALASLRDRFSTRLAFGTAGLRGEIAAGPNRMNRVVVIQAAAGLAAYLLDHRSEGIQPSVVIGYDGRKNSEIFAQDTAEIMAGVGIRAILLPRMLPTPLVAFAVRELNASAGVMVTASHNPPADNGYKVYLGDLNHGSQIVSPDDADISDHIDRVAHDMSVLELPRGECEMAEESVIEAYVALTASLVKAPLAQLKVVYTAMHGVGWETFSRTLEAAGFDRPIIVAAQNEPDPNFPTVAFPNPEEPGALDLAYATAREAHADLIIANDPDADRLAVAIPDATQAQGYRRLTGNEVGSLLGWWAAERAIRQGTATGALACSIVSSPALAAVAAYYKLDFEWTLTGFKWVSRAPGLLYGFEEALGYLVNPETVRDKDGISAGLALLWMATDLAAAGKTLAENLDEFSMRFGHFASDQVSLRVTDISRISDITSSLRATPPTEFGGIAVTSIDDLAAGFDGLAPADVLRLWLADGSRVMIRPSGTEPKLKIYLDTHCDEGSLAERRAVAQTSLTALRAGAEELVA